MSQIFPRVYDAIMSPLEHGGFQSIRRKLLAQAQGCVLEIGAGTGASFPYYTHADSIVAIEPDPLMRQQSLSRVRQSAVPIKVIEGRAESLPFPAQSFDTVVGTLVFCTIPDPDCALEEIKRVLKPGGNLLLFEHVRLRQPFLARMQDWFTPAWKHLCGGCHLNRDTLATVTHHGFHLAEVAPHAGGLLLVMKAVRP